MKSHLKESYTVYDLHSTKITHDLITGSASLWCNIFSFIATLVLYFWVVKNIHTRHATLTVFQLKEYFVNVLSHIFQHNALSCLKWLIEDS